jgi:hypothetical protein
MTTFPRWRVPEEDEAEEVQLRLRGVARDRGCGAPQHAEALTGHGQHVAARLGFYPIVNSQYSSTTLYQLSYHIQSLFF